MSGVLYLRVTPQTNENPLVAGTYKPESVLQKRSVARSKDWLSWCLGKLSVLRNGQTKQPSTEGVFGHTPEVLYSQDTHQQDCTEPDNIK